MSKFHHKANDARVVRGSELRLRQKRWREAQYLCAASPVYPECLGGGQQVLPQPVSRRKTAAQQEKLIQAAKFSLSTSALSHLSAIPASTLARRLSLSRVSTNILLFTETAHLAAKQLCARSFGQIVAFARAKYPPLAAAAPGGNNGYECSSARRLAWRFRDSSVAGSTRDDDSGMGFRAAPLTARSRTISLSGPKGLPDGLPVGGIRCGPPARQTRSPAPSATRFSVCSLTPNIDCHSERSHASWFSPSRSDGRVAQLRNLQFGLNVR